ncbi:Peptidyl-tRNA hydrolase [Candidatus Moranella endobia PCVAL]|uniref:Peptidyl-tRNA hydrolase n=1 Tax=Moranella endobia (strain PCIT) TaxID=903503 RepID=F7XXS0_MOREP|nr:aminoacyl-tRNA hydrolase [Candidatus Moranella endobia]AEI74896.1 peptidyl-tRNA hydrolase [Candidatus Moranella endobia PCIT]AGJ61143.1 Peptidyl-tRNA hydrolase [Candidatus Moranella endobia PCVAL]
MSIKLIVGLSNPGKEYATTRHNAGAWYVELLAEHYHQKLNKESKFYGYTGKLTIRDKNVLLLVPTTFMNLSGKAVMAMAKFYHIAPEEVLVAHDELNLLPGSARLKLDGGHGGHNGLKNLISSFGNNSQFYRLRIGIGHPGTKNKVVSFVLSQPPKTELQLIAGAIDEAIHCTLIMINNNAEKAINRLHAYQLDFCVK